MAVQTAARTRPGRVLGPADRVTLVRAVLAVAVAVLVVVASTRGPLPAALVGWLVALASVALVLDAVDGHVARRTGTASAFGARFDMETDAFLILVLSVYVARTTGWWWVLAIGAARYLFVAARRVLPRLRGTLPPRHWCKVVAALQGVVLTVVASGLLPSALAAVLLLVALALLAESFGREVVDLWRASAGPAPRESRPVRPVVSKAATVLAGLVVWLALVLPNEATRLTPAAFVRIPLEGLVVLGLALVLAPWARRTTALVAGVTLAALVLVKALDMGFHAVLDRPFDPLADWTYLGPGYGVLGDSVGRAGAQATAAAVVLAVVAVLVLVPWAVLRSTSVVAAHRDRSARALVVLGVTWVLCAVAGVQVAPGGPVASTSAAALAVDEVGRVRADLHDRQVFAADIGSDRFRSTPGDRLLTGLRGKDVLLVFVESYGRVAVQDSSFSPGVDRVLDAGTRRLARAGFSARSAFLTSPTFGAASWLAHSSLQSGLWVDSQQRYDQLLSSDRLTLTSAFERAGWRTVSDVPADTRDWPEGARFYGYDAMYDARNVGYAGPSFSYASMPDQYTLAAFRRRELAPAGRRPVMAEIDLVSSHHPWTPLPHPVPWQEVGDGSVFDGMPERGAPPEEVFRDPEAVRAAYGRSIEYSLGTLVSWVRAHPDPDLVLVVLGDHQPHSYVTGPDPGHDVPVSVVAHDPAVLERISGWGWQDGLRPHPDAPVWPMDGFRDRFLEAYGPG
ncbi:CDP-alcohol phosphatidyltransferase family protein [Nocardioides sp. MAHUQ-72]|uniref:CDP-alcohol phosphatidyltransferase family protein n=1 Tax=unclassified Nocardioides TaxID=2615069 RepID=UPI00360BFAED